MTQPINLKLSKVCYLHLHQVGWKAVGEQVQEGVRGGCVPPLLVVQLLLGVGKARSEEIL